VHPDIQRVLISEVRIRRRVAELGREISTVHAGHEALLIAVLRGAAIFAADLIRHIEIPTVLDFMAISSYGDSTRSSGVVQILKDVEESIAGRRVILVEDIVDTGLTSTYLARLLAERQPERVEVCALLDKPARRRTEARLDYRGFTIPDEYVVGYGLDYRQRYRGLPYVGTLKPEALKRGTSA